VRPHISYSELSSFANGCQWKWKLDYLEDRRSKDFSVDLDYGTAVHASLESYLRRKDPVPVEAAIEIFNETFSKLYAENGPKYAKPLSAKDHAMLVASGPAILKYIKDCPDLQGLEPVHNEYPLFEDIARDGEPMKFKGFIDIVFKGKDKRGKDILWICDFKTCSWGWDREKRSDVWRHYQLFLYKYFLCKKFNIDPKNVRVAFILCKKRPSKGADPVEWFAVSAGPVSVQRALDVLNDNITEMIEREKDNSFKKNRTKCEEWGRKCPYLDGEFCKKDD
jgi:hypothetical protein